VIKKNRNSGISGVRKHSYFNSHSNTSLASSALFLQNKYSALNPLQTAGRSGSKKIAHFSSAVKCIHLVPAGLPSGIPGIGEVMDGYMQHAPQFGRQFMGRGS
jgi:hypothetical protein